MVTEPIILAIVSYEAEFLRATLGPEMESIPKHTHTKNIVQLLYNRGG